MIVFQIAITLASCITTFTQTSHNTAIETRKMQYWAILVRIQQSMNSRIRLRVGSICSLTHFTWQPATMFHHILDLHSCMFVGTKCKIFSQKAAILHFRISNVLSANVPSALPSVWNSLPTSVLNCDSLTLFKARLKTHLCSSVSG